MRATRSLSSLHAIVCMQNVGCGGNRGWRIRRRAPTQDPSSRFVDVRRRRRYVGGVVCGKYGFPMIGVI